jgi:phosphomannomutase
MTTIKFGTDGWRAIIGADFTVENVARVSQATAAWLIKKEKNPTIVLGHDCRFAGKLFSDTAAKVFIASGIHVLRATEFVSTPMVSLGVVKYKAHLGIIITASHNPPDYNGYKIKGHYGGPLDPSDVQEIEKLIAKEAPKNWDQITFEGNPLLKEIDIEDLYLKQVQQNFDLNAIRSAKLTLAYDAMFGAGQRATLKLFPDCLALHCDENPGFHGQAPEPIDKNLRELAETIKRNGKIAMGLATDGDADRLGLFDSNGEFIDSHHIILLLIHYLVKYKNMKGKVVVAFSVTGKLRRMCEHYGLELQVVKIGFKYICSIMVKEDVLVGGEESGGIAIKGHIPERDGIWIGLTLMEFMARTGKTLEQLIKEVYDITGPFRFGREDLHISESQKQKVLSNCKDSKYGQFGNYTVKSVEDLDGYKFIFDDSSWMMIRASGTEPVLRVYAEAGSNSEVTNILDSAKAVLLN